MCLGTDCGDGLDRRRFIAGATATLVGWAATGTSAQPAPPTRVLDSPAVQHGPVEFVRGDVSVGGYLARPGTGGPSPGVLVVAGNLITEEYIPNTCAALALAGFVGLAPNIFHPVRPNASPKEMDAALAGRTDADYLADIEAGAAYLRRQRFATDRLGILGFCSGGRRALLYAGQSAAVRAVVSYHAASATTTEEVARVTVPTLLHHGAADRVSPPRVSEALAMALTSRGVTVELFVYDGADHGFLAYTRQPEYNPDAAVLSWTRTIAFLTRYLRA